MSETSIHCNAWAEDEMPQVHWHKYSSYSSIGMKFGNNEEVTLFLSHEQCKELRLAFVELEPKMYESIAADMPSD